MINIKPSPTADTRTCDFANVSKETLLESSHQHIADVRDNCGEDTVLDQCPKCGNPLKARREKLRGTAAQHLKRELEPSPGETRWTIVFDDPDRAPLFFKGIDAERIARETHKKLCDSWTCELFLSAANLPLAAQPPQELVSLREMSHKWVAEQAELGERTDNKQGLSEYRIDAAEQAFEAGWRAALTRGAVGPVVLASRCMRHRNIPPMNRVCADGAECPICAQHNPPDPVE